MTARAVAVEVGATHLCFAHAEAEETATPTVHRIERLARPVLWNWRSGAAVYSPPAPAVADIHRLHGALVSGGNTIARCGIVVADPVDGTPAQRLGGIFTSGTFNKVIKGINPNWVSQTPESQAAVVSGWITQAGLPAPTSIGKAAAAAHQMVDVVDEGGHVLVIDIGARAATIGMVTRRGGRFQQSAPCREVQRGGSDRVDAHIASLAMRTQHGQSLSALGTAGDPAALASFFASVREVKHSFAANQKATVQGAVGGHPIEVEVWRHWLDQPLAADMEAVAAAARALMTVPPDVILLVGGGATLPAVERSLSEALQRQLTVDAKTDLAEGAVAYLAPASNPPSIHPSPRTGWTLAIDFGTTFTVTATVDADGVIEVIDVEGNGSTKMPSSVFRGDDGSLVVGKRAVNQAVIEPANYVATPKRLIGKATKILGGEPIPVVELVAAVLKRCGDVARKQRGGTPPEVVRLTHPATWPEGGPRLETLRAAARAAGLGEPELLSEPEAAANRLNKSVMATGKPIVIYDFGGGTFDAAVLRPAADGFDVVGTGGRDPLGGEDIDDRIMHYLGQGPLGERPEWVYLTTSEEPTWRSHHNDMRAKVREAKETLSLQGQATIVVTGLQTQHQFTREQLLPLIDEDVNSTLDELEKAIADAELSPDELGGIYLIGGSSQLPLVTEKIIDRFGFPPTSFAADPKTVVAQGAAVHRVQDSRSTRRSCRLGAHSSATPGVTYHVEHRLSFTAADTIVRSVPNRWPSLEAYVVDEQQRVVGDGVRYGAAQYRSALGADALVFPSTSADGLAHWSSYQLIGDWAIHSRWPQTALDIEAIRVMPEQTYSPRRPPLEFGHQDGAEPEETVTITARVSKLPLDSVTSGYSEPVDDLRGDEWLLDFFWRLRDQKGPQVQPPVDATFADGTPCKMANYRYPGKRGRCWYAIVNGRGVNITVEAPQSLPLPTKMSTGLRDSIVIFP